MVEEKYFTEDSEISCCISKHLEVLIEEYLVNLEKQIQHLEDRNSFGYFLAIAFFLCSAIPLLTAVFNGFLPTYLPTYNVYSMSFGWIYLIMLLIPVLWLVQQCQINLNELGITTKNLKKSVVDGLTLSFLGIGFVLVIAYLIDSVYPSKQWFFKLSHVPITLPLVTYLAHSGIQEFITRGVLQSSIQSFFVDEKGYYSVLITSVVFGIFHVHFGVLAIVITFFASVFFGWIYLRTYNLVGVTLVHYILGYLFLSTQSF